MALTAARTELNVSLVGEDETIRMLEDAKKRMAELEAKTRSLTGATQAQTQAAKAQEAATTSVNGTLGRMAGAISGPLEGIGKLKESISKGIEIFGFLGSGVTAVITAFNFLSDAFDDSDEKAAALEAQMKKNKAETDRLKGATDALSLSLARMQAATGASAATLAASRAELAELRGDTETARFEREGVAVEQLKGKLGELRNEEAKREVERKNAVSEAIKAQSEIGALESKQQQLLRDARREDNKALRDFNKVEARERAAALRAEALAVGASVVTQRVKLSLALKNRDAIDEANVGLQEEIKLTKEITNQRLINLGKPDMPEAKAGGGGGSAAEGPSPEDIARQLAEEEALRQERRDRANDFRIEELDEERKHQRRLALAGVGEENLATLRETRDKVAAELASLPQGAMAAAFAPLRTELEKRLVELDALAKQHAQMGIAEYFDQEAADKVLSTWEAEQKAVEGVNAALSALGETRLKAAEDAAKMREQLDRENLAGYVTNFSDALQTLGQVQAPAFEVVSESLAGINAQMGKFKDGQQSLTTAIVGSAGAIAGAVGKKIDSVKVEAGIRALFETAMGFATLGNPAESAGHFTAALMFGLVAGGAIKATPRASDGGGSKAPAKAAASTRDSTMSGGGGTITNVYNLQTGIVDGQSTAMAFRRAEMTARNTGMASAGGW
jgi:hypothetical protein